MAKDKGWEFLFSEGKRSGSFHDEEGNEVHIYSDGSGYFRGADGSDGYIYSDGSGYYRGADGSNGYKYSDGSGYFRGGSKNVNAYQYSDGSGYYEDQSGHREHYAPIVETDDPESCSDNADYNGSYNRGVERNGQYSTPDREGKNIKYVLILACILFLIPICVLIGMEINKTVAEHQGKISAGYYGDLVGQDYQFVEAHFRSAGFTNIELIDLNDSGIAFWNDQKVAQISIGGVTNFDSSDYFDPDTPVVISYH
jgi:hypothetical protein